MEERARQRALVRRGYDAISLAYRGPADPGGHGRPAVRAGRFIPEGDSGHSLILARSV
jgi:hypothetical protein